jgi:hypothetical protein
MAIVTAKIDLTNLNKKIKSIASLKKEIIKEMLPVFVGYTPVKTGNARRNTTIQNDQIVANYNYAAKLDQGSSRQAPNGMTEPTKKQMIKIATDLYKKGLR